MLTLRARAPTTPIAEHVLRHGDGVRDIALWVDDAREAFARAVERGAKPAAEPAVLRDDDGEVVIAAFQHLRRHHPLARRAAELQRRCSCPASGGCRAALQPDRRSGCKYVDHCVGNVELGKMNDVGRVLRAT